MKKQEAEQLKRKQGPMESDELTRYLNAFREQEILLNRTFGRISIIRLIVFCIAAGGLLIALAAQQWWGWFVAGAAVIGFIGLLLRHMDIGNRQSTVKHMIWVYEQYQKRLEGTWQTFSDTGMEFLAEQDFVSADLDVFGPASLYQMICVAHTRAGRQRLAEVLQQQENSLEALETRQKAVAELAAKSQFALEFEASALGCEVESGKEVDEAAESKVPVVLRALSWIYPAGFAISILGGFLHWWSLGVVPVLFFLALMLSWIMAGYCQRKVGELLSHSQSIQNYLHMLDRLAVEEFEADELKRLQGMIKGEGDEKTNLLKGLKKLERLLSFYNVRYNPIVHWLLSGCCLYDFHLTAYAVKWKLQYGTILQKGIAALGEVEMLSSLAVLERIRKVTYPAFIHEGSLPAFRMEQVCHPLLKAETAVSNCIAMQQESVVITGSNMSGKTTFLRTIGLNLVLAYAGGPVCAEAFEASVMRIFTSMRVVDDVQHGISTFYAEILRIKEMVEYGKWNRPMLCLIDEIFKGTNSADRIVGAEAVIRKLSQNHIITIVSTHDFELCKLAENYHFEENYKEDKILFDYKLKQGICTTTNALYLLKMAGLTE